MTFNFCGIPCTPPNQWELQFQPLIVDGASEASRTDAHHVVAPQLQSLDFYADFYNEHHTCCWPRTLFDTHIGEAAEAVACASAKIHLKEGSSFSPSEGGNVAGGVDGNGQYNRKETAGNQADVYLQHVIQVAEQLFRAQLEKPPRAPHARRIVYHQAVPPVLRCSEHGDSLVYVLKGQIVLRHCCHCCDPHETSPTRNGCYSESKEHRCSHAQRPDALARDIFPLFLLMVPSAECAGYLDSEAGSASESNEWRAQPMVLALESVSQANQAPEATEMSGDCSEGDGRRRSGPRWCAVYSPFTWLCNPLGNQRVSSLLRTNAAVTRVPRRPPHTRSTPLFSSRRGRTSPFPAEAPQRGGKGGRSNGGGVGADLSPLTLAFGLYATVYTSPAAKQHILAEVHTRLLYVPHVTQAVRFGFGGSTGADGEAAEENAAQLALARSRRPKQLMRLLESTMKYRAATPNSEVIVAAEDVKGEEGKDNDAGPSHGTTHASHDCISPPRKASRRHAQQEVTPITPAHQERSPVVEVPAVRTSFVGTLRTARPVARELCAVSRSTTLVSVIRKMSQPTQTGEGGCGQKLQACGQRDGKEGWPLRVQMDRADKTPEVVELSPLHTLQDVANALRRVGP
ncbi:hypothetical protein ABB37_00508 [Leptomonas pyrrhocoris]|uniref:Uncharacterized protein n=1 Tax=Leptomonas pyrrhocoris TaxID=157538 RepID=A0A0N0VHR2_LEPPY|nr:hypothetical protein ABB37_00508 [Leptomonas pyrrhocoris]KPA86281.1 hypothetical protein ABB37_00508 [Leptomonas pyrrhocoris]|eukprot:XP_015664720.1 hypothetical protein ABB37_00508 [Leptomonas pyrrhocoris]